MLEKMNLPNKLTMLRIILVPIFIIVLSVASFMDVVTDTDTVAILGWVSLAIYVIAAITDTLDGQISRKNNIVTKFGKIMDPLADKLLVSSGFIMLTGLGLLPAPITAVVVFRDFFVNSLRMFGSDNGKDVAAGLSGKIKTVFQMLTIVFGLLGYALNPAKFTFFGFLGQTVGISAVEIFANVAFSICAVTALITTIWSFVEYFLRFKDDINVEE